MSLDINMFDSFNFKIKMKIMLQGLEHGWRATWQRWRSEETRVKIN